MEAHVIYGGIAAGGTILGFLLRGAFSWGTMKKIVLDNMDRIKINTESIKSFEYHINDSKCHLIEGREDAAQKRVEENQKRIEETLKENHAAICNKLDIINARCEKRGTECGSHFGNIERKIASFTRDPNGDK